MPLIPAFEDVEYTIHWLEADDIKSPYPVLYLPRKVLAAHCTTSFVTCRGKAPWKDVAFIACVQPAPEVSSGKVKASVALVDGPIGERFGIPNGCEVTVSTAWEHTIQAWSRIRVTVEGGRPLDAMNLSALKQLIRHRPVKNGSRLTWCSAQVVLYCEFNKAMAVTEAESGRPFRSGGRSKEMSHHFSSEDSEDDSEDERESKESSKLCTDIDIPSWGLVSDTTAILCAPLLSTGACSGSGWGVAEAPTMSRSLKVCAGSRNDVVHKVEVLHRNQSAKNHKRQASSMPIGNVKKLYGPAAASLAAIAVVRLGIQPGESASSYSASLEGDHQSMVVSSVLVSGEPRAGKSSLVRRVLECDEVGNPTTVFLNPTSFLTSDPVRVLRDAWADAVSHQPAVLVVDDCDSVFQGTKNDEIQRQLLVEFVSLSRALSTSARRVLLIGTTASVGGVPALVNKVFSYKLTLDMPDPVRRTTILNFYCAQYQVAVNTERVCKALAGFSGSDIESVIRQSYFRCRSSPTSFRQPSLETDEKNSSNSNEPDLKTNAVPFVLDTEIVLQVAREHSPSGSVSLDPLASSTTWKDIGGMESVKELLKEVFIWPFENASVYASMGIVAPRGVLLHGPPGTGKTMLAEACATEASCRFLSVKISDLMHSAVGESEKTIRELFRKARLHSPCILFIDEFQAVFSSRDGSGKNSQKMMAELLSQMDGFDPNRPVLVMAATNMPEAIDKSLLRAGRFDKVVYVGPPNLSDRVLILERLRSTMPWKEDVDVNIIADRTSGFTGAQLKNLCQSAGVAALQNDITAESIGMVDFTSALQSLSWS